LFIEAKDWSAGFALGTGWGWLGLGLRHKICNDQRAIQQKAHFSSNKKDEIRKDEKQNLPELHDYENLILNLSSPNLNPYLPKAGASS